MHTFMGGDKYPRQLGAMAIAATSITISPKVDILFVVSL